MGLDTGFSKENGKFTFFEFIISNENYRGLLSVTSITSQIGNMSPSKSKSFFFSVLFINICVSKAREPRVNTNSDFQNFI